MLSLELLLLQLLLLLLQLPLLQLLLQTCHAFFFSGQVRTVTPRVVPGVAAWTLHMWRALNAMWAYLRLWQKIFDFCPRPGL